MPKDKPTLTDICERCGGTKRIEGHDVKCTQRGIRVRATSRPCPDCKARAALETSNAK